jgi:hypothetical protein
MQGLRLDWGGKNVLIPFFLLAEKMYLYPFFLPRIRAGLMRRSRAICRRRFSRADDASDWAAVARKNSGLGSTSDSGVSVRPRP